MVLAGCATTVDQVGYVPTSDALSSIQPGQSKSEVVKRLGSPTSLSAFDDQTWYYISRKTESVAFFEPKVLDQHVVAIEFDKAGRVTAVHTHDLADGRDISPVDRVTPTSGREMTVLQQLLGNVGRFSNSGAAPNP